MYLFLATANYCGSTALHDVIATSSSVTQLPDVHGTGCVEGVDFFKSKAKKISKCFKSLEANMEIVFNLESHHDMNSAKKIWESVWDKEKEIKLQKDPDDIFRVQLIQKYFDAKWLVMVRNPYQHLHSLYSRPHVTTKFVMKDIAYHVMRSMEVQMENVDFLKDNCIKFTYEEFTNNPQKIANEISTFIPMLSDIDINKPLNVKMGGERNLSNMNCTDIPKELIESSSEYFKGYQRVFDYWGYQYLG
jgi:hypothetical protein